MKELYGISADPWMVLKHPGEARIDKPQSEWMCGATIYRDTDDKREVVAHVSQIKEADLAMIGRSPEMLRFIFQVIWGGEIKDGMLVLTEAMYTEARRLFRAVLDDAGIKLVCEFDGDDK